jgi:peptidoglycan/LPS O-acetylase OafA/YrhL
MGSESVHSRFLALDGLRGIAALAVFWAHLHLQDGGGWALTQAGIAVDFFFLLSGFVLAHAYEPRLGRPGAVRSFFRDRIIRLHPLLLLSMVPAVLLFALAGAPRRDPLPWLTVVADAIPFPALWVRAFPIFSFPYNPPAWSLFWELVVNLPFALLAPRLSTRMLLIVTAALIAARFGYMAWVGPLSTADPSAALRAFPFFALGMLTHRLYHSGWLRPGPWIGALAAPVLIATLLLPSIRFGSIFFPLLYFVAFPLIIAGGAGRAPRFPRICAFLGGMSYPLYVLHLPVLSGLIQLLGPQAGAMAAIEPLLCFLIVWLAWRFYDEPLRAWLRRRFGSPGHRTADLPPGEQAATPPR